MCQLVLFINITGQGGNKGAAEVANADPDGCTMLFQHAAILASYLTGRVDFSWDGLISYAKDNPGEVLAAASIASNTHFILLQFQDSLDISFNIIGYEGGRERVTALLSDTVQLGQVGESDGRQYFPDQLQALAIFSDKRSDTLPDVPTAMEQGHDIEISMARGVLLPGGASDDLVALYAERFEKALQDPAAIESLTKMGSSIRFVGGQDYADRWADQAAQWEKVARDIGIYMVN